MIVYSEIAADPMLAHELLNKPGTALLEFGVEFIKLMRENVYSYWRMASSIVTEQMNGNVVALNDGVISAGHLHDNPEAELLLVIFDGPLQIENGDLGCNSG